MAAALIRVRERLATGELGERGKEGGRAAANYAKRRFLFRHRVLPPRKTSCAQPNLPWEHQTKSKERERKRAREEEMGDISGDLFAL